ncbi:MAG: S24/S26 family peptidase [Bacilli bacterium]
MTELNDLAAILKDSLNEGKTFTMPIKGISMEPFLKEGDQICLTKPESLKKHDIIFYQRKTGQYVLHRIYQCKEDYQTRNEYYVLVGDNQTSLESPIYPNQVLAKAEYVIKKEKKKELKGVRYSLYLFFSHFLFLRKVANHLRRSLHGK